MSERFGRREIYEHCEIRRLMVRLTVIQATVTMPDRVEAEVRLVPIDCNRAAACKSEGIRCMIYDRDGQDPCPGAWKGEA